MKEKKRIDPKEIAKKVNTFLAVHPDARSVWMDIPQEDMELCPLGFNLRVMITREELNRLVAAVLRQSK